MKIQSSHIEEKAIEKRLREGNEKVIEFESERVVCSDGLNYSYIIKIQRTSKVNDDFCVKSETCRCGHTKGEHPVLLGNDALGDIHCNKFVNYMTSESKRDKK